MSNTPFKECDMCHNPYPYMCSECASALHDELDISEDEKVYQESLACGEAKIVQQGKIFIGSGEDVQLEDVC